MINSEQLSRMYESGMSLSQVAETAGVQISRVRRALRETGTEPRSRKCGIGKIPSHKSTSGIPQKHNRRFDYEQAGSMYESGMSIRYIAISIGVDDENIRYALKTLGVERRKKGAGSGDANHQFKGGVRIRRDGYVIVRGTRAKQLEHRVIAAKVLGRPLAPTEVVHHINGNKADNRPQNLIICTQAYHSLIHCRMNALFGDANPFA